MDKALKETLKEKYAISSSGTAFNKDTPKAVQDILDSAMSNRTKVRLWYGDRETGRDWGETHDVYGFIGRSFGDYKIPILLLRCDSTGGVPVMDNAIVRISIDKKDVYRHPTFHAAGEYRIEDTPECLKNEGYNYAVFCGDDNIRICQTLKQAENEIAFHEGRRNIA